MIGGSEKKERRERKGRGRRTHVDQKSLLESTSTPSSIALDDELSRQRVDGLGKIGHLERERKSDASRRSARVVLLRLRFLRKRFGLQEIDYSLLNKRRCLAYTCIPGSDTSRWMSFPSLER